MAKNSSSKRKSDHEAPRSSKRAKNEKSSTYTKSIKKVPFEETMFYEALPLERLLIFDDMDLPAVQQHFLKGKRSDALRVYKIF